MVDTENNIGRLCLPMDFINEVFAQISVKDILQGVLHFQQQKLPLSASSPLYNNATHSPSEQSQQQQQQLDSHSAFSDSLIRRSKMGNACLQNFIGVFAETHSRIERVERFARTLNYSFYRCKKGRQISEKICRVFFTIGYIEACLDNLFGRLDMAILKSQEAEAIVVDLQYFMWAQVEDRKAARERYAKENPDVVKKARNSGWCLGSTFADFVKVEHNVWRCMHCKHTVKNKTVEKSEEHMALHFWHCPQRPGVKKEQMKEEPFAVTGAKRQKTNKPETTNKPEPEL